MFLRFVQRGDVGNPILLARQMKGEMLRYGFRQVRPVFSKVEIWHNPPYRDPIQGFLVSKKIPGIVNS